MNTLICLAPGKFAYREGKMPELKKDHAILRIRRIGICGTDMHAFEGTQPYFDYPRILGHELAAELVEADGAPGFVQGQKVTFIPYYNCGQCVACRTGKPNCCVQMKVFGVHMDGGMVEYLSIPSRLLVGAEGLGFEELALVEPLSIGAHGLRRAGVQEGEFVLVVGAGPIGIGTMELARIAGARVIAMDVNERRLQFCRDQLSIRYRVNPLKEDAVETLKAITGGEMPTVVIDASGSLRAINNGLSFLAHGGRYVLIGLQKEAFSFSHPEFHKRESTLMSSRNATRADFEQVAGWLQQGLIKPVNYITHRIPFEDLAGQFDQLSRPEAGVVKAMAYL